jgi:penicillin amidase
VPIERELVANGNDRGSGAGLGYDYASPDRVRRIRALVEAGAAYDPRPGAAGTALSRVSLDTDQPAAATVRRLLADPAVRHRLSPAGRVIRTGLLDWDGRSDASSDGAALFAAWRSAYVRWLLAQPGLAPLTSPNQLPGLFARWLDPIVRIGTSWPRLSAAAERLDLDVVAGTVHAVERVAADPPRRPWGATHRFRPIHALAGRPGTPALPDVGLSGDYGCVLAARSVPGMTDDCTFGPVARYLWDLADREDSRWVVPLGASARTDSPHRVDQLPLWARGETIPLVTAWDRLRLDEVQPGLAGDGEKSTHDE